MSSCPSERSEILISGSFEMQMCHQSDRHACEVICRVQMGNVSRYNNAGSLRRRSEGERMQQSPWLECCIVLLPHCVCMRSYVCLCVCLEVCVCRRSLTLCIWLFFETTLEEWIFRSGGEERMRRRMDPGTPGGAHKFIADKMHYCTHQIDR